jgi:hypothetical protein
MPFFAGDRRILYDGRAQLLFRIQARRHAGFPGVVTLSTAGPLAAAYRHALDLSVHRLLLFGGKMSANLAARRELDGQPHRLLFLACKRSELQLVTDS